MTIFKGHQFKLMCLMSLAIYHICWRFVKTWNLSTHYQCPPFFLSLKWWKENGKLYRGKKLACSSKGGDKTFNFIFPYAKVFGISFTIDHVIFLSHCIEVLLIKSNLIKSWGETFDGYKSWNEKLRSYPRGTIAPM